MPIALIIDDDTTHAQGLADLVRREGFTPHTAATLSDGRTALAEHRPDVVLVDLFLPDGSGLDLNTSFDGELRPEMVLITGNASVESAVDALRAGVTDYLTKPIDLPRLKAVLAHVGRTLEYKREIGSLRGELRKLGRFGQLIGGSASMQRIYGLVGKVSPTDASVFVIGESGTGKELIAQTVHELSARRTGPFVAINCGAVSPTLIESEMFGHEKGSFTGAGQRHKGHFERASGGTLFLDEITEMPMDLQVKLLRVLETGSIMRTGGTDIIDVDVRIVAATNRPVQQALAEGKLREDLYYRLHVFPIELPPLRDREGDVTLLAQHFLAALNDAENTAREFTQPALERLERHEWPGNVRELKNVVHRAFILADPYIDAHCLPDEVGAPMVAMSPGGADGGAEVKVGTSLSAVERQLILATLDQYGGDKKKAADVLGISLKTLYNRLNQYKGG